MGHTKRAVLGRRRGAAQATPASLLAGDASGTQPKTTSVVHGQARDVEKSCFGRSNRHHQRARIFAPPGASATGEALTSASVEPSAGKTHSSEQVTPEQRLRSPLSSRLAVLSSEKAGRRFGFGRSREASEGAPRCPRARRFRLRVEAKARARRLTPNDKRATTAVMRNGC